MLRLGRLCAGPLKRHATTNELGLAFGRIGADAARHVATTSASAGTKKPPPPPPAKGKATAKSALSPKPRPATAAATPTTPPKKEHEPVRPKHGRLTRKARPPRPAKWVKPPPRRSTPRTVQRVARRRAFLSAAFNKPRARVARYRLGFHLLHHAQPLRRGRRGRLSREVRAKFAQQGELQTRRNRRRMGRPEISLDSPRRWNRPLPVGVLPAYDAALDVIRQDARLVRKQAVPLRRQIARLHAILCGEVPGEKVEGEARRAMEAELEALRAKLRVLDVQSEVNLPEVRWSVANAMADMSVPSHRHLVEQRWRKDGDLDLLMERLHQMNVIPDALPVLHPSLDLHVTARLMPEHFESLMKRNKFQRRVNTFKEVVPGNYLTPRQTRVMPKLYANVFHTDVRLYTMLLVDLDVPDEANQTYTTFLHWLKPNIPLSATHMGRIPLLNTHTRYIPPHPQRGTPYHRYTLLLLPQPPVQGRYTLNTEALLTAQQARLTQSIRDTAAQEAQRAKEVARAVGEAMPGTHGRTGRAQHPTHPNAALPHPESGADPLAGVVTQSRRIDVPIIPDDQRLGFNVRAFAKQYGLNGALGGGAHMWREVWDKYVGAVYRYELHKTQPVYGRPPRDDPQREAHSAPTRRKYRVA
ncbi:hypothetical protein C8R47DRAFT_1112633 [Mycena vitilis]|nr:hypothetical protein C8R47DRAFT_1112633 [Mycena vitilis]